MGASTHGSNTKRIWTVFIILSLITFVEVVLGIIKPAFLFHTEVLTLSLLNWIFIILTIWKAYYIMWAFMHLEGEKASFRWSIVGTLAFLGVYLTAIVLTEGHYIHEVFQNSSYRWIF
ncbi:cytochrome C oxidase subunit IV family protein [Flavobacterium sp. I3-2]|uniref:cytochrome C oxidase subunit IV family protein n=1 Tax=Flavobacterium sp. I3-2 TaxID=2748319 RepID=UPI0015B1D0E4|nr:cytochrome C oxidase subunit IV family protein [Flavobacterium sp. I3-2]